MIQTMILVTFGAIAAILFFGLQRLFGPSAAMKEALRFLALARYAYNQSFLSGSTLSLWIDPRHRSYGLQPVRDFDSTDPSRIQIDLKEAFQIQLFQKKSFNDGKATIVFHPGGIMDEKNLLVIRFLNGGKESIDITPGLIRREYDIVP